MITDTKTRHAKTSKVPIKNPYTDVGKTLKPIRCVPKRPSIIISRTSIFIITKPT